MWILEWSFKLLLWPLYIEKYFPDEPATPERIIAYIVEGICIGLGMSTAWMYLERHIPFLLFIALLMLTLHHAIGFLVYISSLIRYMSGDDERIRFAHLAVE